MNAEPTILQILPRLESGGVERGTIEIAGAIRQAGMKSLVVSAGGALLPKIGYVRAEHITLPVASKNPFTIYQNALRLNQIIKDRGVNLIHARSRAPAWSAYYAAKWAGIPFITTFHGIYSFESKIKQHYNSIMVRGARVIAVSQFVEGHILKEYNVDPSIVRRIPRGVDFEYFDERHLIPDHIVHLTKTWRLPDDHIPIIFCPGRITRIKGQHVLIEALALMKDQPFLCIIAGADEGHEEYRLSLEQSIINNGLEGKVRLCNATSYMTEAYTLADIVVVPSTKPESFGRVAIEAQAMGKLVVATDHGGARETILQNETGYLVPPEDPQTMMEAIRFGLQRDAATINAMGSYARQHVRRRFSSDQMKEKTIAVYRELL